MPEDMRVRIEADAAPFLATLDNLKGLAAGFGTELNGALRSAAISGRSLDDVLRRIALNMAGRALSLGLAPLRQLTGSLLGSLTGAVTGKVTPFAKGGVVDGRAMFPLGRGMGLMGEAGAEAILPLSRGPDGRLGVAAGGQAGGMTINFNVTATDAASFRKSEAQITGLLASAAARGARSR